MHAQVRLQHFTFAIQQYLELYRLKMHTTYNLAQTPVLSPKTINAVRKKHTNLAIGDVNDAGFRKILNPFNFAAQVIEPAGAVSDESVLDPVLLSSDRGAKPEFFKIPEFVEGLQTLEFMGFDNRTANLSSSGKNTALTDYQLFP